MKRILSLFLCIVKVVSMLSSVVFADDTPALISSTTTNANAGDGVSLTKTSTYDPSTGKVKITLEAYTTGTVISSTRTVPTDIVLVLDVSGSMTDARMTSMKNAVNNFITSTKTLNSGVAEADQHSIAIVKFADDSFYSSSDPLTVGNHKNDSGYNYTEVIAGFTTVNDSGATALQTAVNSLTSGGATAMDYGLDLVECLFDARTTADLRVPPPS